MLLRIPSVLTAEELARCRRAIEAASWVDGSVTAGHQSVRVKENEQLPEDSQAAHDLGALVMGALERTPRFIAAALPLKVFPPLFNRYRPGHAFGVHVDNAVRQVRGTPHRVRTDLSATLFLAAPDEYDGGELVVEDTYGAHSVKLPAGDLILYPASRPVPCAGSTRGERIASFFWIQSMVRDDADRTLLFDLDNAIQRLAASDPDNPALVQLTGVYHNLLRRWSEL